MWSSKNRTKVCGWMGYVVRGLRMSAGHEDAWIRVPVRCYMECHTMLTSWRLQVILFLSNNFVTLRDATPNVNFICKCLV